MILAVAGTSSFGKQSCSENLLPVSYEEKLRGAHCCLVRAEARAGPIGGYYNSCSFAHWSGISSPQGQGAVSGILIGMSGLIFTSLHILHYLLANKERFCNVWLSQCVRALAKNKNSGKRIPIAILVALFISLRTARVVNSQNKPQ